MDQPDLPALPATTAPAATALVASAAARPPLLIRMHPADNVAIVANDGGLPAGTLLPDGLMLCEKVPQGHKVALIDLPAGATVDRKSTRLNSSHPRLSRMPSSA